MTDAPAIPDTDEQMLARLAARDLAAAERVHDRLMAAEDVGEIADLGRTYQRFARSLRQTLALKAKLKHDKERAAADAARRAAEAAQTPAPPPGRPAATAVARRMQEVTTAVLRAAWRHEPRPEAYDWYAGAVIEWLDDERERPDFGAEALDDHVVRACLAIGLPPEVALAWRDLPDPPDDLWPNLDGPPRRSSA